MVEGSVWNREMDRARAREGADLAEFTSAYLILEEDKGIRRAGDF